MLMLPLPSRECRREPRKADRMEQQSAEFYERVREGYRELAARERKRIVLIDGSRDRRRDRKRNLGKIVRALSM